MRNGFCAQPWGLLIAVSVSKKAMLAHPLEACIAQVEGAFDQSTNGSDSSSDALTQSMHDSIGSPASWWARGERQS
jgi:hypothetical protein